MASLWNAVIFMWKLCSAIHGVSKYTGVNRTAKGLSFISTLCRVQGCFSVLLIVNLWHFSILLSASVRFPINNSQWVETKPFGRGGPAVREVSLVAKVARTTGRQTWAASPRWEEGGHVMGCCHWHFSLVWGLQSGIRLQRKTKEEKMRTSEIRRTWAWRSESRGGVSARQKETNHYYIINSSN